MKVGRMVAEVRPENLLTIGLHGKNGSPITGPNQAGNSPQDEAHDNRVFLWFRVVIRPPRDGFEAALLIEGLRGVVGAANLKECSSCMAPAGLLNHALEERRTDASAPVFGPNREVVDVKLSGRLSGDDVAEDGSGFNIGL